MSYVVIRGCSEKVNLAALNRWFGYACGMEHEDVSVMIERLRTDHRWTVFLDEKSAQRLMRRAPLWGLTGVTLHADDDMSEYPPPPAGFWTRWWHRWRSASTE